MTPIDMIPSAGIRAALAATEDTCAENGIGEEVVS
jgi:hypothetical protein